MEWLRNIGNWFIENKDTIVVTLTGIATSGAGVNLWQFFKSRKVVKDNTANSKALTDALKENSTLKTAVTSLNDFVSGVAERVEKVNNTVVSVVNSTDVLITKVNAMLDVQSLVYQTIKDEATRTAVNNILTNAKYAVTAQRAELIKELNALKEETAKQNAENNARVEEAVAKAVNIVEATDVENKTVIRG